MPNATVENLLELLSVRLNAFAVCEIGDGCALDVAPLNGTVVHYVLQGDGSIESEHGILPIRSGTIAVIPKKLPKRINGHGPVTTVMKGNTSCPLTPEIVKFRARQSDRAGLVLGCASVSATVGEGLDLFDHLQEPLAEAAEDELLPFIFSMILHEISRPSMGTKAILETMMKQILLLFLRNHLKRRGLASALYLPLMHPQLGRALVAMLEKPGDPHCVTSLSKLAGMSRSRFNQHFTTAYGATPTTFLQSVRLKRAAKLLRSSTMPVKSIAAAVGFASRSHFSKAFREQLGVDPTAFRQAQVSGAEADKRHRQEIGSSAERSAAHQLFATGKSRRSSRLRRHRSSSDHVMLGILAKPKEAKGDNPLPDESSSA